MKGYSLRYTINYAWANDPSQVVQTEENKVRRVYANNETEARERLRKFYDDFQPDMNVISIDYHSVNEDIT